MCKILTYIVLSFFICYSQINKTFTGEFPVTVNGGNFTPGIYYVCPAIRVLDVLKKATDTLTIEKLPRDIKVNDTTIDIIKYILKNEQDQNPIATPGMDIYVNFPSEYVVIKGAISNNINKIAIHKNEKLSDFISLFTLSPTADNSYITLLRDNISKIIPTHEHETITLKNNDFVIVPEAKSKLPPCMVEIKGEINKPGYYGIQHGKTQLKDLLPILDILPTANISKICIYRKLKVDQLQSPRQEIAIGLKNLSTSHTTFYIDSNQILNDKDIIEIPKTDNFVYVRGFVVRPSGIEYSESLTVRDYIKKAGGFSKSADKINVRVITSCGINYQIKNVNNVQPGDVILVPESSESKWIKTWAPIISVLGSTASIIAAVINLSK